MLRKIRSYIGEQKVIPGIGEFKETLAQAAFWVMPINFMMLAATFYFTTLRHVAPWFTLPMFIVTVFVIGVAILIAEFKYMTPSIWAFRAKQMGLKNDGAKRSNNLVAVAVSGGFDPINGRGHLTHIQDARKLGDRLVVILNTDEQLIAKGNKKTGTFYPSINDRRAIVRELESVDEVVVCIDKDGTVAETLRMVRPDIFAKGGDRTPDNMPRSELAVCKEIGCEVVYDVGEAKETSSSELARRVI